MSVTAIASPKGGVGKTTLALNLGYALARRGWPYLVVDADPLGGIGYSLAPHLENRLGLTDVAAGRCQLSAALLKTKIPGFAVLPFGSGSGAELNAGRLSDVFFQVGRLGFHILVDTPAGLSGLTAEVLAASDFLVSPIQAEPLALRMLPRLLATLAGLNRQGRAPRLAALVPVMVQSRVSSSVAVLQEMFRLFPPGTVLETYIPRDPAFLEASGHGVPLAQLRARPPAVAAVFDHLAAELEPLLALASAEESDEPIPILD
ncbi:MAG: ParA family protein [Thermoanaerobaculia bacterium]